jgi:hypothetical protein
LLRFYGRFKSTLGVHFCYRLSSFAAADLRQWQRLIDRLRLKGMASPLRFVPVENSKARRKRAMQLEKATKVLKRVWKVLVWIDLVVVAALLLFFSQFFSYDVFVSNFHRQAIAANSVQPR